MTKPYGHPDTDNLRHMNAYYLGRLLADASASGDEQKVEQIKRYLRSKQTWRTDNVL